MAFGPGNDKFDSDHSILFMLSSEIWISYSVWVQSL